MIAKVFVSLSALILFCLGCVHLVYTFVGPMLRPRDQALQQRMGEVSPVISSETSMWEAWVGFNASHSFGAMLFGAVYGYLAVTQSALLFGSAYLSIVGGLMLFGYVWLGKRYWFSVPFRGLMLATTLYVLGFALTLV